MTGAVAHTADTAGDRALIAGALTKIFDAPAGGDATAELKAFGIREMIEDDPAITIPLLFERQGGAGATSRALDEVLLFALGDLFADRLSVTPGAVILSVSTPDAISAIPAANGQWRVRGLAMAGAPVDEPILAVGRKDDRLCLLAFDGSSLEVSAAGGLDPRLKSVFLHNDRATPLAMVDPPEATEAWECALAWARIALASEILGAVASLLSLAGDHARERTQFGRPIGSFQAVKHKLAEVRVALDGGRASVSAAAADPAELSAMVAKSMSGRAGRLAATNCLQTFGGIGFTWEHGYHLYMKRVMVLDQLLGSAAELPALIGARVLALGSAPRLGEL